VRRTLWVAPLLLAILVAGLLRVRMDVDVFNLLPSGSATVEGLRLYQRTFGSSRELIVSLRAPDADLAARSVRSLAERFESAGLGSYVIWQSPFREDPEALAELLAYLWFNQPPSQFEAMAERFRDDRLHEVLAGTLERMATSFQPQEVARLAWDPYGLSDVARAAGSLLPAASSDPFAGADGSFRILFLGAPEDAEGFWRTRQWLSSVRESIAAWRMDQTIDPSVTINITGNPAFVEEVGSGLLRDLQFAALGTLLLVAALFWLAYRRWRPLLWLVALLVLVLVATVAVGGLIFGTLNAVSLGFAAILLGLAADYGLILYQERISNPRRPVSEVRAAVAPGILWAAATTAGAFFMIGRSSLPGLTELGTLVGIGILLAAAVMLTLFLPPLARAVVYTPTGTPAPFRMAPHQAWVLTALMVGLSMVVLSIIPPTVDTATNELGPKNARARAALAEVKREVGGFNDALWLIVTGRDEAEVGERLTISTARLEAAVEENLLAQVATPGALWPRPADQEANRSAAGRLSERRAAAVQAALDAGFARSALGLTEGILASWKTFASGHGALWPTSPGGRWLVSRFAARDGDRLVALGRVATSPGANRARIDELAEDIGVAGGVELVGWSLLSGSLITVMKSDIRRVILPMVVILLVLLGLAFRRVTGVVLSIASLALSLVGLLAVMALAGWSWNLMNIMALPLLFGAGVDYSIHIQHALRRHHGDAVQVRNTIGRAILLCAASTAVGFGTLGFGSNAGVASLGRVCAVGVILVALVSVFLLPAWWRLAAGRAENGLESG